MFYKLFADIWKIWVSKTRTSGAGGTFISEYYGFDYYLSN